jgi:putative phosphoserine phosphatase/1-acylglycerol-3-phosphate O-acyltransferase
VTTLNRHLEAIADSSANDAGIAFFDLDRTLIGGYSIIALARETALHGARQGEVAQAARLLRDLLRHRVDGSGGNYHRVARRLAKALAGVSEATLAELGERAYRNHIARTLYREAITLIESHRAAGRRLVIISAASRYQVEPVARVLGIDEICCTRLEVQGGHFTGQVIAPLCHGEGKLLAARRVARQQRTTLDNCWFYSDSSDDLPLLRRVGRPVAVNPSERLSAQARARGWPQLNFNTRGLPSFEHLARTMLTVQTVAATTAVGAIGRRLGLDAASTANRMTRLLGDVGSGFAGLDFEVEGAHHLDRERPAIFIFNHQSLLDSLVLAHLLRRDVVAFCKRELATNPLVGPMLRQVETIFVDRDATDQSAVLRQALDVLGSGRSLVIAPEGTRSTLGEIQPFRHGAFLLAKKAGVPIVPMVLHNVKDALPKGGWLLRPATIRITVLPPLQPEQMGGVRQVCSALEEQYSALLGRSPLAALPYRAAALRVASGAGGVKLRETSGRST